MKIIAGTNSYVKSDSGKVGDVTEIMVEMNKIYSDRMGSNISIDTHRMYMVYPLSEYL